MIGSLREKFQLEAIVTTIATDEMFKKALPAMPDGEMKVTSLFDEMENPLPAIVITKKRVSNMAAWGVSLTTKALEL